MTDPARVAIVRPSEYSSIEDAVADALQLIGIDDMLSAGDKVLLKPNLTLKRKSAITEKDFVQGVARSLKSITDHVSLGDSCGRPSSHREMDILRAFGYDTMMDKESIAYVDFEGSRAREIINPSAKFLKKYMIAQAVCDADVVVNLPRPKSHVVAGYTGAIKNYWGILPGGQKGLGHMHGTDSISFAEVLADNFQGLTNSAPRRITVMDARTYMEGVFAPAAGIMQPTDVILASTDELALDVVMLAIGRSDGMDVPHLQFCAERGLGAGNLKDIEIAGKSIEEVRFGKKLTVIGSKTTGFIDFFARTFVFKMARLMPNLDPTKCSRCGECLQACPMEAIEWQKEELPQLDKAKCVGCLSCSATCPEQALKGKPIGIKGLFMKNNGYQAGGHCHESTPH